MLSIIKRNGKSNILFKQLEFDNLIDTAFFVMLTALLCIYTDANYIYYVGFFLFVGLSVIKVILRLYHDGTVNIPAIFWWFTLFTLISLVSVLWSEYPNASIAVMTRLVQILAVLFCMSQTYATRDGFNRCLKLVCWSGIACAFYIFIKTPVGNWFEGQLGGEATGGNPNAVGMTFTVCILFTLYYAYYMKKRIYYVFLFIELMLVIMTSSRKSVLTVLLSFIILSVSKELNYKMITRLITAVAAVALILYAIMNIEQLYWTIGRRLESMVEQLLTDSGDYSMYARNMFIEYAQKYFLEKPVIGSGVATFIRKLGAEIGLYAYAHNNYYELLVGVGIVGFTAYYSFYAYLTAKLFRMSIRYGDDVAKIMLMVMLSIIICEYGTVLYYSVYAMIFICMAFQYVCVFDNDMDAGKDCLSDRSSLMPESSQNNE